MRDQDEAGAAATQEMVALGSARPGDLVIAGITGGSSALMGLPLELISLTDYAALTQLLLGCGANIIEVNAVRKHLAMVGSGRLAKIIHPGVALVNLTVSDVIGDPLVTTLPIRRSRPRRRWQKTIFSTNALYHPYGW